MASYQPQNVLMLLLGFSAADLAANRAGYLSLVQRGRLLLKVNLMFLVFAALLPIWAVSHLRGLVPIEQVLIVVLVSALGGFVERRSAKLLVDVVLGRVGAASGPMTVKIYQRNRRTLLGTLGEKYANGIIDGVAFVVPVEMAESCQGNLVQMYYTPLSRLAVSGELLIGM